MAEGGSPRRITEGHANTGDSQRMMTEGHTETEDSQRRMTESHTDTGDSQRRTTEDHTDTGDSQRRMTESHTDTGDSQRRMTEGHTDTGDSQRRMTVGHTDTGDSQRRMTVGHTDTGDSQRRMTVGHTETGDSQRRMTEGHIDTGSKSDCSGQHIHLHGPSTVNTFTHCSNVTKIDNVTAEGDVNINSPQREQGISGKAQEIMEWTKKRIDDWTKDMVCAAALKDVMNKLHNGANWITIKGSPGEGKTTVAYMALAEQQKSGRDVIQVMSPEEFDEVTLTYRWPVVMLDDILGDLEFDMASWLRWKPIFHKVLDGKEHRSHENRNHLSKVEEITIVLVGRNYIFNSASVHMGRLFNFIVQDSNVIDMSHTKRREDEEKLSIFKTIIERNEIYLDQSTIDQIICLEGRHGFPHVCRLFVTFYKENPNLNVELFFKTPLEFLNETVALFLKHKSKLYLFKKMIKEDGKVNDRELETLETDSELLETASELIGAYLRKEDEYIVFDHPSIYDSVAFNLCKNQCLFVIQNCSLRFIHERLRLPRDTTQHTPISESSLVVQISRSYVIDLAKRFAMEISNRNLLQVLSHQAFTDRSFMSQLTFPLTELITFTDACTHKTFLSLIASSRSPVLLMYIVGQHVQLTRNDIKDILFGVCRYGASDVFAYLMQTCDTVDINATYGAFRETPLMIAADSRDSHLVDQLLAHNPDLNARADFLHITALHYFCMNGLVTAIEKVISMGADIEVRDINGHTLQHYACKYNQVDVMRLLMERQGRLNVNATYEAYVNGNVSVVEMLFEKGLKVNMLAHGESLLACAIMGGYPKMISCILDKFDSLNVIDGSGMSPLALSCYYERPKTARYLIEQGAYIESTDLRGMTAFHYAATAGSKACVDVLLKAGAMVNVMDENGRTPLHTAAGSVSQDWISQMRVDVLLKSGADINQGCTCCEQQHGIAVENESKECISTLLKVGANINQPNESGDTPLLLAATCGYEERVDVLLKSGADVNLQCEDEDTVLHAAAVRGDTTCVAMIVKAGADVNMKSRNGHTPLHAAAGRGYKDCIEMLLKAGANVNEQSSLGETPLHIALRCSRMCPDHIPFPDCRVLLQLIEHGAEANLQDTEGKTPLDLFWAFFLFAYC